MTVDSTVVKPDSDNQVVTITYSPDTQYTKFNYIDDTMGDQLKQEESHGYGNGYSNSYDNFSQVAKYTRTATIDLVTGKVTYTDWATKHGWDEYIPEAVSGYTPFIKKLDKVAKPDKDTKVEITYTALPINNNEPITPAPSISEEPNKSTQPTTPNKDVSKKPALKQNKKKQTRKQNKKQNKKQTSGKRTSNNGKFAKRNRVNTRANGKFSGQTIGKLVNMTTTISTSSGKQVAKNSDNIATDIVSNSQSTDNLHANNTANQLPQTGIENDKTTALAGILLASMGVAVALGASRKKRN